MKQGTAHRAAPLLSLEVLPSPRDFNFLKVFYCLDSSYYSFSYVAGWSSGKDVKELKASLERIRSAADEMITDIDKSLEKQMKREQSKAVRDEAR